MESIISSPLHFFIPDPQAFPSGGNIYNAQLIAALKAQGLKLGQSFAAPLPNLPAETFLFVDTLFLSQYQVTDRFAQQILVVHHLTSMEKMTKKEGQKNREKERMQLAPFDAFLATSDFTAQYLQKELGLSQPIVTVKPALDLMATWSPKAESGSKVIIVANLIERKGILAFLKAWSKQPWPEHFSLSIIGSRDLEPAYAQRCLDFYSALPSAAQRQIHFLSDLSRTAMAQQYREADLLLSAASVETFGMAIQEARAFGLPILALAGGYTANHIEQGRNGFVFDKLETLVEQLSQLVNAPAQLEALRAGAMASAKTVRRSWKQAATELLAFLNK